MALEAVGISKSFGSLLALDNVSCSFLTGEVHAVVGENGAGKSTLAAILTGLAWPDKGSASLDGRPVELGSPSVARALGIELIHQHFTLVPDFTVEENLALTRMPGLARVLQTRKWAEPALKVGEKVGWTFEPEVQVRNLSVGAQQRLEIIRVLGGDPGVVVFDEPTAVLTQDEVADLMRVLDSLKAEGKIVILIAHKLSEVMRIADRVTVLRKGKKVAEAKRGEFDAATLAFWMVGDMPKLPPKSDHTAQGPGVSAKALVVKGDRGEIAVNEFDLEVCRGEIVGIGGVDGNGQTELAEAIAQVRPIQHGTITWEGEPFDHNLRIAYIPQDRLRDGLALGLSIQDNMLLTEVPRPEFRSGPFLRLKAIRAWANSLIQRFSISAQSAAEPVRQLSGGNQQKVVVSRSLDHIPDLLVVCGPSRGLDIRATEFVRSEIIRAREGRAAVLLFSSDLDELAELSDRTIYLNRGRAVLGTGPQAVVGGNA